MKILGFLRENANWLAVGLILSFTSSYGQTYFISIFAGEIREEFGLTHGQWGASYTIGTAASAVVMVWAGALTDVFRVRTLAPVVFVALALSCVAMAINVYAVLLPMVIFALRLSGQGMSSHLMAVSMSRWFVAGRGRALAVASMGFAIGQAVLPYVFVEAKAFIDWRQLWLIAGAMAVLAIGPLWMLLSRERTPRSVADQTEAIGMRNRHWTRAEMLHHPLFWFLVPSILGPSAWNTALFFQQVHLSNIKGISHIEFVSLLPLFTGVAVAATFISGWAVDRFGAGWIMVAQAVPMAMGFWFIQTGDNLGTMALALGLIGVSSGAMATLPGAFAAEFYGTRYLGGIKAIWTSVMVLGSAIGPGVTGWLIDQGIDFAQQSSWIALYFLASSVVLFFGVRAALAERSGLPG